MTKSAEPPIVAEAARLRRAIESLAAPASDASELAARLMSVSEAAAAAVALPRLSGSNDRGVRQRVIDEVRLARLAVARCLRARASVRDLLSIAAGGCDEYGSDGAVTPRLSARGIVRHV
jgi:hypothetical protein